MACLVLYFLLIKAVIRVYNLLILKNSQTIIADENKLQTYRHNSYTNLGLKYNYMHYLVVLRWQILSLSPFIILLKI